MCRNAQRGELVDLLFPVQLQAIGFGLQEENTVHAVTLCASASQHRAMGLLPAKCSFNLTGLPDQSDDLTAVSSSEFEGYVCACLQHASQQRNLDHIKTKSIISQRTPAICYVFPADGTTETQKNLLFPHPLLCSPHQEAVRLPQSKHGAIQTDAILWR